MLFCGSFCNKTEFLIPGIKGECLQEILRYLYTGKISLNSENVIDIMIAQNYLMITDLRTVIRENVKYALTNDNSFQLLTLSDLLNDTAIYQESFRFIQIHFQDLMCAQKEDFTNISLDILKSLLSTKNLSIDTERSVWLAIEAWVEKAKSKRKRHVPLLLTCLALGDLDENLATEIIEHDLIVNNSHVEKLSPSEDFSNGNHDRLKSIVNKNNPHLMNNAFNYRIPEQLHLIGVIDPDNRHCCQLYLTYDENLDVWRKILDVDIQYQPPLPLLFNIENNLYALGGWREWAIDLIYGGSVSFSNPLFYNSSKELSVKALRNKIYFLQRINEFESETGVCAIDIYDCDTNSWV